MKQNTRTDQKTKPVPKKRIARRTKSESVAELNLEEFKSDNPHYEIVIEKDKLRIEKAWGNDYSYFVLTADDANLVLDFNQLKFFPQFDAVFHKDTRVREFIYSYLLKEDEETERLLKRSFEFYIGSEKFSCGFGAPTERLMRIANVYQNNRSVEPQGGGQLIRFRDAQRLTDLPEAVARYFGPRIPLNFFVEAENDVDLETFESIARHINFIAYYYEL